jgi:hypothetical protein
MTDDESDDGGSGTVGDSDELERQAGSYARDAEQDPAEAAQPPYAEDAV